MPTIYKTAAFLLTLVIFVSHECCAATKSRLLATVLNGTYAGVDSPPTYNQDYFLGIPYAQPPVGDLRFRVPRSLDTTWDGIKEAQEYGLACYGYGPDNVGYAVSEDCLTLNIVRPKERQELLPVAVWIHGGGFFMGSAVNRQYNLSFIVQTSVEIGKPIIGVSLNYRLHGWGFLASKELQEEGSTNMGLRDQRLALHWIQENIEAFGGDPSKVTIWGESAGAVSAGIHLAGYGGRDDGLFRAAIAESGGPVGYSAYRTIDYYEPQFERIAESVSCGNTTNKLACLRSVPAAVLNDALNVTAPGSILTDPTIYDFSPMLDGDLIQGLNSISLREGKFVKVPLIIGANTDEGILFQGSRYGAPAINNDTDFVNYLENTDMGITLSQSDIEQILRLYPDIPALGSPEFTGDTRPTDPTIGYQFKRISSYTGDILFIAGRRLSCEEFSKYNVPAYCYRFNAITPQNAELGFGACHGAELPFVFNNILGVGYSSNPFDNAPGSFISLAKAMASMWVAFVHDLDPNGYRVDSGSQWPTYAASGGKNIVFDGNAGLYLEPDVFRKDAIAFIIEKFVSAYHRR